MVKTWKSQKSKPNQHLQGNTHTRSDVWRLGPVEIPWSTHSFRITFSDERKGDGPQLMRQSNGFSTCTAQSLKQLYFSKITYVCQFGDVPCNLTSLLLAANDQKGWLTNLDWIKSKAEFLASSITLLCTNCSCPHSITRCSYIIQDAK